MIIFFLILIILSSVILGFIILVQNPKGGGLAGNIAGFSNQFMGVKQTNDLLERGTWIFVVLIALLCLFSSYFMKGSSSNNNNILDKINTTQGMPAPAAPQQTAPATPQQTAPPASNQQP